MKRRALLVLGVGVLAAGALAAWLARPRGADHGARVGASWTIVDLGEGPRVVSPAPRATWLGDTLVALSRLDGDTLTIEPRPDGKSVRVLLSGQGSLAPAGAAAVPLAGGWLVPLSRPAMPRDAALVVDRAGASRVVELRDGERVAAARAGEPPELVLTGAGDGGAVAIVRVVVHADGALEERERATVPYTPSLSFEPGEDLRCGMSGERFAPLLARAPSGGVLVAVADDRLYPLRFPRGPDAVVTPVCGPCPPVAVSREGDDVTLLVNVGRKLAKSPVPIPARPVRAASGACVDGRTIVAVAAGDAVWVAATSSDGGWKMGEATRVAGPWATRAPDDVRVVASSRGLDLAFRRPGEVEVRRLSSTDAGRTWR